MDPSLLKRLVSIGSMRPENARGILDNLTKTQLVEVFTTYPNIKSTYGYLYQTMLSQSFDSDLSRANNTVLTQQDSIFEKIDDNIDAEEDSTNNYVKINSMGQVNESLAFKMNIDSTQIIALETVYHWWLLYILNNAIMDKNYIIKADKTLKSLFSTDNDLLSLPQLWEVLAKHFNVITSTIPQEQADIIYVSALKLQNDLNASLIKWRKSL